ncbi:MAG: lipid-binding SYLF domain-containing protein [Cyanobacteria bacterium]|nr:lipid-binding SYLF domain-containing protein [Cyanobacteriota bacterium]
MNKSTIQFRLKLFVSIILFAVTLTLSLQAFNTVLAFSAYTINRDTARTITSFKSHVNGSNEILRKAKGLLIMPAIYQAGFGVGGKYGEGALQINKKTVGYYNLIGASLGFQLGGQKKSMIVAFMDDKVLSDFRSSQGYEFGADASAVAITAGGDGRLNINDMNKPILVFVIDQKGLMYNLSLKGSKFNKINK